MRALSGPTLAALLALAGSAACGGSDWEWKTPPVLDEAALLEHLRPQGQERLVVANFWATW